MNTNDESHIELKADVFRVIRANTEKTPLQILDILKEEFSDTPLHVLVKVLEGLQ